MDFIKILRSFEEFLYEVMTWLLFYPRTMARVVWDPLGMMAYSDREQFDREQDKYTDALSPPLFMMLSILLAHIVELWFQQNIALREGFRSMFQTDQSFLLLRCAVFGIYPMIFAVALVRRQGLALDRETLRAPFFAQCYVTAPFAMVLGVAGIGARMTSVLVVSGSSLIFLVALGWFLTVQTRWFHARLGMKPVKAAVLSGWLWLVSAVLIFGVGAVVII